MTRFITMRGNSTRTASPFYIGIPQHERIMSKREAYGHAAERTGYKATAIRSGLDFDCLGQRTEDNGQRGRLMGVKHLRAEGPDDG